MVYIETYDTPEEMRAALQQMREDAKAGLHPEQRRLTYGDTWVEFADVGERLINFGRISTLAEIAADEPIAEAAETCATVAADLDDGVMYGKTWSRQIPDGEWGTTHKASVWPIETRLFLAARIAGWDVNELPEASKVLLQIAYSAWRAHRLASASS